MRSRTRCGPSTIGLPWDEACRGFTPEIRIGSDFSLEGEIELQQESSSRKNRGRLTQVRLCPEGTAPAGATSRPARTPTPLDSASIRGQTGIMQATLLSDPQGQADQRYCRTQSGKAQQRITAAEPPHNPVGRTGDQ